MKKSLLHALGVVGICCLGSLSVHAAGDTQDAVVSRDASYEQYLHINANPDEEKITPARVIRWMMGLRGQAIIPPSSTEFQPIVDANQRGVRAVAAFTYKFF